MSHIKVKCSKCGLTGSSKNPYTRNVFADHPEVLPMLSIMEMLVPTFIEERNGTQYIKINAMVYKRITDDQTDIGIKGALKRIADVIRQVLDAGDEAVAIFTCEHDFHPADKEEAAKMDVW